MKSELLAEVTTPYVLSGVAIDGDIFIEDGKISRSLIFTSVRVEGDLKLNATQIEGRIVVQGGSMVLGEMELINTDLVGGVNLIQSRFHSVNMQGAKVGKDLELADSIVREPIVLNAAKVAGTISLRNGCFSKVDATSVHVGVDFVADAARLVSVTSSATPAIRQMVNHPACNFEGCEDSAHKNERACAYPNCAMSGGASVVPMLRLNGAIVEGSVFLREYRPGGSGVVVGGCFHEVQAVSARVGTSVVFSGSRFHAAVTLDGAFVGGPIFLWKWSRFADLDLGSVISEGDVVLDNASFCGNVDLSEMQVTRSLKIGADHLLHWAERSVLDLTGTVVGAIRDRDSGGTDENSGESAGEICAEDQAPTAWAPNLILEGFDYRAVSTDSGFLERDAGWYREWLDSDQSGSSQPSRQLEMALRTTGRANVANELAIARLDEQGDETGLLVRPFWIAWKWLAGYGYAPERALAFVGVLIGLGFMVAQLGIDRQTRAALGIKNSLLFSFARAVPYPNVGRAHDVSLNTVPKPVRWYFNFHTFLGYVVPILLVTVVARFFFV